MCLSGLTTMTGMTSLEMNQSMRQNDRVGLNMEQGRAGSASSPSLIKSSLVERPASIYGQERNL